MRIPVASLSKKILSTVFAAVLVVGLMPAAAFAAENGDAAVTIPAGEMINQVEPLEVVAQQESTKSYFLAQTLEDTHTVPMVSANLPLDSGMADDVVTSDEGAADTDIEKPEQESAVAIDSVVVGSFEQDGIVYAIEPGGDSVAVVATDCAKFPIEVIESHTLEIPFMATSDGIDYYSVTRIADDAFASLTVEAVEDESAVDASDADAITTLVVPASVTTIEDDAFAGFDALQYIVVSPDNQNYFSYDGCLYTADQTNLLLIPEGRTGAVRIASSVTIDDSEVFSHCPSDVTLVADADGAASAAREDGDMFNEGATSAEVIGMDESPSEIEERTSTYSSSASTQTTRIFCDTTIWRYVYNRSGYKLDENKECNTTKGYFPFWNAINFKWDGSRFFIYGNQTTTPNTKQYLYIGAKKDNDSNANGGASVSGITDVYVIQYDAAGKQISAKTLTKNTVLDVSGSETQRVYLNKRVKSSITWKGNGGTPATQTSTDILPYKTVNMPTPARDGYVFMGWYTQASGGTKITSGSPTLPSNMPATYYAQWLKATPRAHSFSDTGWIARDVINPDGTTSAIAAYQASLPDGYTPTTNIVAASLRLMSNKVELVCVSKKNFNTYTYRIGVTQPDDASAVGNVESAWLIGTDANGNKTGEWLGSSLRSVTDFEDISIHLNGFGAFGIAWDANDGECVETVWEGIMPYDTTRTFPVPTRDGYTFVGWFTEIDGGVNVTSVGDTGGTYYAHWVKNTPKATFYSPTGSIWRYKHVIGANTGSMVPLSTPVPTNIAITSVRFLSECVELRGIDPKDLNEYAYYLGLTQESDTTVGGVTSAWLIGVDVKGSERGCSIDSNWLSVADYDAVDVYVNGYGSFSVSFDSNGGNEGIQTVSGVMPYGPWTAPTATRSGYTITGWYDGPNDDANYVCATDGAGPAIAGATTLFAHWAPVSAAVVPLNVTAKVDLLGIADQEAVLSNVLDDGKYQGYIESRSAGALKVTKVDFTPFSGADELFGTSKSRVLLEALAQGSSSADYSFALDAADSEDDAGKLAPFSLDAGVGTKKHITYRFDIPDDVLASIDRSAFNNKTTSIGRVSYTVTVDE